MLLNFNKEHKEREIKSKDEGIYLRNVILWTQICVY
jgi:hypothetical protein